ncbi:MFS transporter [Streptomyces cellulosae]|uniref:MFS transporter n=1 Tax=Streptomyces cellulosae TaxID=1968 RepID=A0ABW7YEU0_STRCE
MSHTTERTTPTATAPAAAPAGRTALLAGVLLSLFLAAADSTVVGSLLPTIAGQLGREDLYSWLISAFLLTSVLVTPLAGAAADRWGGRRAMLSALAVFAGASVAVAAAQNMPALIAARAAQGVGAGAVAALTYVLIGQAFDAAERGRMQGMLSSVWGLAAVVGPALGTAAQATVGWRWIFLLNLPLAAVAAVLVRKVPAAPSTTPRTISPGALLSFAAGLGGLLLLIETPALDVAAPAVIALALLTVLGLAAHITLVRRRPAAALIPSAFAVKGDQRTSGLLAVGAAAVLYASVTLLPLALTAAGAAGATESGLFVITGALGWVIGSAVCGGLLQRLGPRTTAAIGALLLAAGPALLAAGGSDTLPLAIAGESLAGLGTGFVATTSLVHTQNTAPAQWLGAYTAAVTLCRNIGAAVGVNLLAAVQLIAADHGYGTDDSYCVAFAALAVIGLLTVAGALRLPRRY